MRAVDYFAGAGGWTTGAQAAGVNVVAALNHWPVAVETHRLNHPEIQHLCEDAVLFDPRNLPAHDLFIASPACQGHSRARGKERPHHDAMRATAWAVVYALEVTRAPMFAVENVPEMLAWPLYPSWRDALERLGYRLSENVLDAADFGVPQNRVRLFILGTLEKTPPAIRAPEAAHVPAASIIDWDAPRWSPVVKPGRAPKSLRKIETARGELGSRFLLPYYGATRAGRSIHRPLGTLTTRDRYAVVDGERMRMLSVAEQKRGMSFPDGYRLAGDQRQQTHQLGNAVCPALATEVLRQLMEAA